MEAEIFFRKISVWFLLIFFSSIVVSPGVDSAEKAVIAYGGVQMGQLEKNVSWIRKRRNKVKQKGISRQIVEQAVLGSRKKLEEVVRSGQK